MTRVLRATDLSEHMHEDWAEAKRPIRVLLIQPPTSGCVRSLLPQVEQDGEGIGFKPPLGLLYVASMTAASTPHEVKVIDAIGQRKSFDDLVAEARAFEPDLIGISAWTDWWYPAYHTGELLKEALPKAHLCYGGPHVSIYAQATLDVPFVDSVIVGDGEVPFMCLANMLANDKLDNRLPGLHLKQHGVKECQQFFIHDDLDNLPLPDRRMLPLEPYSSVLGKGRLLTTMVTSRGCPHKCTFCKLNFQKTLCRSADNVLREFEDIHSLGIKEVELYDDTFTWARQRVLDICQGLIDRQLGLEWAVRDRVSNARVDLLDRMYAAGCRRVHYGIESGVDRVLEKMRKKTTVRLARRAVQIAKDTGLTVLTYFMFGNLDETLDDMQRTIDFALELDADFCEFSITIPYAGTEMYEEALETGLIKEDYWAEYARKPVPDFMPPKLIETAASLEQLIEIRNRAVRSFYFRPKYIINQARKVTNPVEFLRKAKMGGKLFNSVYAR
ncbi:MAG: radical SAM protein [Vulcanimicrobiota bacterium]